jgi:mRNA interferase RelE/StbE
MKKIDKFTNKLLPKERERVNESLKLIRERKFESLNLRKLKGFENLYRVRVGSIRIIFLWEGNTIEIVTIDRRNDNTYNF